MKDSFRKRLIVFISLIVSVTIFLCVFLNRVFLGPFYTWSKTKVIKEVFASLNEEIADIEEGSLTNEQKELIDKAEITKNVDIYIFADYETTTDFGTMYYTMFAYPQSISVADRERLNENGNYLHNDNRELIRILEAYSYYLFPRANGLITDVQTIEESEKYRVISQHDSTVDTDYMDVFGTLDCGYNCIVRVALESIDEAANIANRFMCIIGMIMIAIAVLAAYFMSKRFTKPITELSDIAKRMSNLDFDVKYKVTTEDEIGDLGHSMNSLSSTLEKTISELKSANIELESDIKQKEEIEQLRTDFISNVTHELKTPIALIQGYAEGLKDNINDDAESRDFYCDVIMDEASKMNTMVKNLLSLSKIESGGIPLEIVRFNLTDVIKSVLASVDILVKKNEITVEFDDKVNYYVWADEYMVEEVITNYVSNAIHYAAGEKIIRITQTKTDDTVRLGVFNTGNRIAEDDKEKLWVKFYKADKARTREYGGTGIGLSIVKAIMEAHHRQYGVINYEDGVEFYAEFDGSEK